MTSTLPEPPTNPIEIPLTGGRVTEGVVRIGATVHRPHQPSSAFIGKLLTHLKTQGFDGAPSYLGRDNAGRDILSYIDGVVPPKFRRFSDEQIIQAGVLIRSFHDATQGSILAGDHPVVCHHDAGPNNVVFQKDVPSAFIDFDLASPGDPLEDIGYMAWLWCISSKPDRQPVTDQAAQVRLFVDSYGLDAPRRLAVFDAIIERQTWNVNFWNEYLVHSRPIVATPEQIVDRIAWTKRERVYTLEHRAVFETALLGTTTFAHYRS